MSSLQGPISRSGRVQEVIIDQGSLSGPGADRGLGRYARTISAALATVRGLEVTPLGLESSDNGLDGFRIQNALRKLNRASEIPYHSTSVYHLPVVKTRPWICSIQDVIPLDLREYRNLGVKARLLFNNSKRSDMLVANSAYTASRMVTRLGVPMERIEICPLPVSDSFYPSAENSFAPELRELLKTLDGVPFVVALADLRSPDPRKRFHWIRDLARELKSSRLAVVVTGRGITDKDFSDAHVLAPLSDADLAALYSHAVATFYPSAYEGQGLPPLEAMAVGCPVVAFRNTSIAEVVQIKDFLIDDPSPWSDGELDAPMAKTALHQVVEKLESWLDDPELLQGLRAKAKIVGRFETFTSLGANLSHAYSGTLK